MFKNKAFYLAILAIFFSLFLYSLFDYIKFNKDKDRLSYENGINKKDEVKVALQAAIDSVESYSIYLSELLSKRAYSKKELENLIKREAQKNDFSIGVTVGFEPEIANESKVLYAPFYSKFENKISYVEESYDYTNDSLETAKWYTEVIKKQKGNWSDPYIGKVAQKLILDYGIPFYRTKEQGVKEIGGVISSTISSAYINEYLHKITMGKSGFAFIVNKNKYLISHPSTALLTDPEKFNQDLINNPAFSEIFEKEEGQISVYSEIAQEEANYYYSHLKNEWVLVVVLPQQDLINYTREGNEKLIRLTIFLSISLILLLLIYFKVWTGKTNYLWKFSNLTALILLFNIIFIWIIYISHDTNNRFYGESKVLGENSIINYVNKKNVELKQLNPKQEFIEIPTGIFIYDIDLKNAYDVAIQGKIWQKIPDGFTSENDFNFVFPQASATGISVRIRPMFKKKIDDYWLYRYDFNATLQFDFNYLKYPLNTKRLDLQLTYPNIDEHVILTPDLGSYDFTDPYLKPGISDDIYMPDSKILSSFFTFNEHNFRSDLGNSEFNGLKEASVLTYNVLIKNVIISSIITYVVPILIVAMLIFLLPFTVSQKEDKSKEGSSLSIIQAAGGFFFVLLLSHIQLRSNIETPGLTYLETFYFVMYFMLVIMSSAVLLFLKTNKYPILEYKENLIFKLSYWPILLMSIYLISLFLFF
ncbi:PDC sensor domain-containing protein [Namhaeicola litoreus]|uniref:Cache domain-containing protein n=1 Tax=Namhaeicola litoreus TaxID=1052145 RepID=A0ABW3XZR0_9FLAO